MNRKTGVLLSYLLMIFEVLSTLLLTPFIIRTLGQAEYGVFKLVAAINAYLLLLDLGLGNAITRFVAKFRAEDNKTKAQEFLGVAIVFYSFIAVVALLIGGVLVYIFPSTFSKGLSVEEIKLGQQLLAIAMITSAVTLGSSAFSNTIIAYEKYSVSRGASIVQIVIRIILTYIVLCLGYRSIGILLVNLFTTVICKVFFAIYVLFKIRLRPLFRGISHNFIKEITSYSSLILLQMIATQINASVDQVLLGVFVQSSSIIIGIYGVGLQIVQYFQTIGVAFTGVLMPGTVRLVESGANSDKLLDEMVRIGRIILMVLILIWSVFLVCGKQFIILWAGKDNIDAFWVTTILMTAYLIAIPEEIGTQILWAKNEHKEQSYLKLLIVLVNVVFTVFLIKINPLIGATIGTFISLVLGDVVLMNILFGRKLHVSMRQYYKRLFRGIAPCSAITILAGAVVSILFNSHFGISWIGFIIQCVIMCIIYFVVMKLCGTNSYEKELISSIIKKSLSFTGKKRSN